MEIEEMLTVLEAAQFLGVSRDKMSRLIKSGAVPAQPSALDSRKKLIKKSVLVDMKAREGKANT